MKESVRRSGTVIINQDSGYLTIDIANRLVSDHGSCTLITGRLVQRSTPLHEDVAVHRIMKYNRRDTVLRLISWGVASMQILMLLKFRYRREHLLVVSNPPFAPLLTRLVRNPYSLLIFDVYPEAFIQYGFLSAGSWIARRWQAANRKVFSGAREVFTLTTGMKDLLSGYRAGRSIRVVPLWSDSASLKPVPPGENPFIARHGLQDRFVVLYSGNLGTTSNAALLADIAASIQREDILFLIIGEGKEKGKITRRIRALGLNNCLLLPWQRPEDLNYSLASAGLAVVSLDISASDLAIPSKLFDLMAVGVPVLGLTRKGSELEKIIESNDMGRCFEPHMTGRIAEFIQDVADNPGMRGRFAGHALEAAGRYTSRSAAQFV
jgi:glycosyltransferase involved in cell wall biosynthesis